MTMTLRSSSLVGRNPELLAAPSGEELVMLSVEAGNYYGLDPIGRRIWDLIETPARVTDICARLAAEYDVGSRVCESDVLAFLDELIGRNIVYVCAE